jgi:ribosomal protein S18 acetylase RimI-like enzyme
MQNTLESTAQEWLQKVSFRPIVRSELLQLEWEGEYSHLRKVYASAFEKHLTGKTIMWVADLQNQGIIGQVFIQLSSTRMDLADGQNRAYLYAFRIRPAFRNAGLGTRMNWFLEDFLIKKQFKEITLIVAKENLSAIRLYNRLGYHKAGYESGAWSYRDHNNQIQHVVEPAWKMIKTLS